MKKRTSPIWKMEKYEFQELVNRYNSYTDILKEFGFLAATGGPHRTLKQRIKEENIDCSHILSSNKGRKFPSKAFPLEEVMIKNSTYSRCSLKKRLLRDKILENKCSNCGMLPFWDNQKLVMILDHKNGINNDHRLENLRLLCPNCNSQTPTFAGRSCKKRYNCKECGVKITKGSKRGICHKCSSLKQRKVNRPSKQQLLKEVEETNYCVVGRRYGVSDNAVRKWIR